MTTTAPNAPIPTKAMTIISGDGVVVVDVSEVEVSVVVVVDVVVVVVVTTSSFTEISITSDNTLP